MGSELFRREEKGDWLLIGVKVVATLILMAATGFGLMGRAELLVGQQRYVTLAFFLGLWVVSYGALLIAALHPNRWVRLFWGLVIALTTAAGWAYQTISGSSLSVFDVLSLWAARHEAGRAMQEYGAILPWALVAFVATLTIIVIPAHLKRGWLRTALTWLFWAPAVPTALIATIIFLRSGGGSQALPTQFQPLAVSAVGLERALTHRMGSRMAVPFAPVRKPPVKHIVFLVEESLRPDYLDFRPGNPVTPHLPALRRVSADFGPAVSGGNCSSYANAILRFTAQPHVMVKSARTYPTLWQWAKKAGFSTIYMDGQSGFVQDPGRFQNFMTMREARFIDQIIRFDDVPTTRLDFALLEKLVRLLKTSDRPLFIYANKNGAHFPFDADYPANRRRFRPTITEAGKETAESKVNSYRNAVAWNVDEFFRQLLRKTDLKDTLIIYTSDHGQNLDADAMTHCSTHDPDPREGLVPLLIITGNAPLLRRVRQAAEVNYGAARHFHIAPTLLTFMGYDPADLKRLYGPSLLERLPRKPFGAFSYGDIFGLFRDEVNWQTVDTSRYWLEPAARRHLLQRTGENAPGGRRQN